MYKKYKDSGVYVTFKEPENFIFIEGLKEPAQKAHQEIIEQAKNLEKEFIEQTLIQN